MEQSVPLMHHLFDVQIIFVRKGIPLIDAKSLAVEDGRVARIYYILYEMGVVVHLSCTISICVTEACHLWRV